MMRSIGRLPRHNAVPSSIKTPPTKVVCRRSLRFSPIAAFRASRHGKTVRSLLRDFLCNKKTAEADPMFYGIFPRNMGLLLLFFTFCRFEGDPDPSLILQDPFFLFCVIDNIVSKLFVVYVGDQGSLDLDDSVAAKRGNRTNEIVKPIAFYAGLCLIIQ